MPGSIERLEGDPNAGRRAAKRNMNGHRSVCRHQRYVEEGPGVGIGHVGSHLREDRYWELVLHAHPNVEVVGKAGHAPALEDRVGPRDPADERGDRRPGIDAIRPCERPEDASPERYASIPPAVRA